MKTLLMISLPLLVAGCWHNVKPDVPPEPVVVTQFVKPDCGNPPRRDRIALRRFSWVVRDGWFSLSADGYEDLSYNISQMIKGIDQLRSEVHYYENCLAENTHVE